jgi:hypothetical protein
VSIEKMWNIRIRRKVVWGKRTKWKKKRSIKKKRKE